MPKEPGLCLDAEFIVSYSVPDAEYTLYIYCCIQFSPTLIGGYYTPLLRVKSEI